MQLNYERSTINYPQIIVHQLDRLDYATAHRLHNLGIHPGSHLTILYRYPFHGPVVIAFDQQKVGIRYSVFRSLMEEC
ncbi:FeoA family protein [Levilactobacillus brevis]|uniref:FeoA family protein n=1 Tax=Levilactobacillus brevis TaxID=1580 RepID=UPI000B3FCE0A|nr:FeoA family protein [Levilactobacillus brevis]STX18569.1 ferrous iron transport protein A [Levilactobacillus brevis]